MKSYCKGLEIDEALVDAAYLEWRSGEAGRKNAWRIEKEYGTPEALVAEIAREIRGRCLQTSPISYRTRREPNNGKVREIAIESVKQQVMDYTAVHCLRPLLDAKIGHYQTASIPGKGQVWAKRHIERWRHDGGYFVKTDVRKCYPSTSHEVCMKVLRKYVRSADVLYLCEYILSTYREGLNIGSYFSLEMENLILSFAYHHIEGLHKERRGKKIALVAHQLWFMDDCLLMGPDKRNLKQAVRSMAKYLREEFGLELKGWKICKMGCEPITMCGFTIWPEKTVVASGTFLRAKRCFARLFRKPIARLARRACSYFGWLKHSDSYGFMRSHGIWKAMRMARSVVSMDDRREACSM